MLRLSGLLFLLCFVSLNVAPTNGQTIFKEGRVFSNSIKGTNSNGFVRIPLPPGDWKVFHSRSFVTSNTQTTIEEALLVDASEKPGKPLTKFIWTRVPTDNQASGWRTSSACVEGFMDSGSGRTKYVYHHDTSDGDWFECFYTRLASTSTKNKFLRRAMERSIASGYPLKSRYLIGTYWVQEGQTAEYVYVAYFFVPPDPKFQPEGQLSTSEWMPIRVGQFPEKAKYVEAIVDWTKDNKDKWLAAFKNEYKGGLPGLQLAGIKFNDAPAKPQIPKGSESTVDAVAKLKKLKAMFEAELITQDEYEAKKSEILSSM